jgi:hypothetical protein
MRFSSRPCAVGGDIAAYGCSMPVMSVRHGQRFAALCTATHAEGEDMAAEAFTRVLGALKCGGGPDALFRSYPAPRSGTSATDDTAASRRRQLASAVAHRRDRLLG